MKIADVAQASGLSAKTISADVKALAKAHLRRIDRKIAELEGLRGTLATLVAQCHGDERPDCPILDDLAGPAHVGEQC